MSILKNKVFSTAFGGGNSTRAISAAVTSVLLLVLVLLGPAVLSASSKEKRKKAPTNRAASRQLTRAESREAEARLSELGYTTGRVDGVIDNTTRNGLIIFQKWERLKVTGRLGREDFHAIMRASAPQPKDSGYRHVEVDLDRQVLLLIDDSGAIAKMVPVSTGSNKQYREKGGSGLAYTPRGRFRIINKIAGWRKSPLGLLYYPSYFSGGVAIHGNPSVPSTPQSHGCIRIPMSAAVSLFRELPMGTIVLTYDDRGFVSAKDWAEADRQKREAETAKGSH
jgi:lipoprotein-anchoring transpeptidase ErfK/SrfK